MGLHVIISLIPVCFSAPRATIIQHSQLWRPNRMEPEWLKARKPHLNRSWSPTLSWCYAEWGMMLWTGQPACQQPLCSWINSHSFSSMAARVHYCSLHPNLIRYLWFWIVLFLVIHLAFKGAFRSWHTQGQIKSLSLLILLYLYQILILK